MNNHKNNVKKESYFQTHNNVFLDYFRKYGGVQMGPYSSYVWRTDPRHLFFTMARYKFCSKILNGKKDVLEVGCGDAFFTPIVLQVVKKVHCVDVEPLVIENNKELFKNTNNISFEVVDCTKKSLTKKFDASLSIDVIEHIDKKLEKKFISNICKSLKQDGLMILGTPNIEAKKHASDISNKGHINLKSAETLKSLLQPFFSNVFIFSMNDEIVHTGFYPMAHYLIAVGVNLKNRSSL